MTAVIRRAEAVLQAFIMMRSSIRPSLMSPGAVDWRMKTGGVKLILRCHRGVLGVLPSSSRTLSPTVTLVS